MLFEQLEGQANQVVKIHTLVSRQALFVSGHDAGCQGFFFTTGNRSGLG